MWSTSRISAALIATSLMVMVAGSAKAIVFYDLVGTCAGPILCGGASGPGVFVSLGFEEDPLGTPNNIDAGEIAFFELTIENTPGGDLIIPFNTSSTPQFGPIGAFINGQSDIENLNYMDADGQLFSVSFGAESAPGVFSLFNNNGTQFLFGDATSFTKAAIPEPTALLTMLPALLFGGFRRMRRRQTSS